MDDELEQALGELVEQIVAEARPLRIVLFGSAARGEAHQDSDLDLLIVMPEGTHRLHTMQHLYGCLRGVRVAFDLLVATPEDLERHEETSGLVYREILREGRELYRPESEA
jgi:predicted nucleotidyltransferase